MASTFRITLKQEEGYDVHDTREFDLILDAKFTIGRASKNLSKGHLLPAKHNVFIDSPVVSRDHAILTANATTGSPQVFITDTKSMHGTYVNGLRLAPGAPKQLSNGDKVQFGADVQRNESYFIAYKYTFNAELAHTEPFSRGFTVPEAESEEEEIEHIHSDFGSQGNPLVLDDSDIEPEFSEHSGYSEIEDNGEVTLAQLDEDTDQYEALFVDELHGDECDARSGIQSDVASTGSAPDGKSDSSAADGPRNIEEVEGVPTLIIVDQEMTAVDQGHSSTTLLETHRQVSAEQVPAALDYFKEFDYPTVPQVCFSPLGTGPNLDSTTFDDTVAPPLPPRPSQKRQKMSGETSQEGHDMDWYVGEPYATHSYAHDPLSRSSSLDTPQQMELPHTSTYNPQPKEETNGIQTPPPTLITDVAVSTPPFLARRNEVSMTEVVDEQPPTPTSINSRKRSADYAFESGVEDNQEQMVMGSSETVDAVNALSVEQAAPPSHRPIAQPRSVFRKALRTATIIVPATAFGAFASIAALTALPESFFTVA